jgi:hypothetical protein
MFSHKDTGTFMELRKIQICCKSAGVKVKREEGWRFVMNSGNSKRVKHGHFKLIKTLEDT